MVGLHTLRESGIITDRALAVLSALFCHFDDTTTLTRVADDRYLLTVSSVICFQVKLGDGWYNSSE